MSPRVAPCCGIHSYPLARDRPRSTIRDTAERTSRKGRKVTLSGTDRANTGSCFAIVDGGTRKQFGLPPGAVSWRQANCVVGREGLIDAEQVRVEHLHFGDLVDRDLGALRRLADRVR